MPIYFKYRCMEQFGRYNNMKYEDIVSKVKEILSKSSKGIGWKSKCGYTHIPIVFNNQIIGEISEDLDLETLSIGSYRYSKNCIKIQLIRDGEVVGFICLRDGVLS